MRARARLTRTARRAQTREGILRTAHAVFLERGFHGATLDEIAAAAGVTKGAVYSNFDSKADLFLAVYDVRLDERLRRFARARSTTRGLEQLARQDARTLAADDPDGRWTA
jgi:AcrR family transcriptional regulator